MELLRFLTLTKALITDTKGGSYCEVPNPRIKGKDDVCIRVRAAAICRTDLYAAVGKIAVPNGRVLGHEFSGSVEIAGESVSAFSPGDRVVVNPSFPCGLCENCFAGLSHRCAETRFLGLDCDGAFAQFVIVPASSVHHLDKHVSFAVGTFAEPVAAGLATLEAGLSKSDRILVCGSGRIAKLTGAILEDAGFSNFMVAEEIPSGYFDAIIETNGLSGGCETLFEGLRPGGTLVLKSREPVNARIPILTAIRKQLNIKAVKYGPFADALAFVSRNAQMLDDYLDDAWVLQDYKKAFALAKESEDKKICFQMEVNEKCVG